MSSALLRLQSVWIFDVYSTTGGPVNTEHLRYFLKVCEVGSIGRAADTLHMSRQALSEAIFALESKVGEKLLTRSTAGSSPTSAGQVLRDGAQRALNELDETMWRVRHLNAATPTLRAGFSRMALTFLGASSVLDCVGVDFEFFDYASEDCWDALARGLIDVAVIFDVVPRTAATFDLYLKSRIDAVMSADHPLANHQSVTAFDLADVPLVAIERTFSTRLADYIFHQTGRTSALKLLPPEERVIGEYLHRDNAVYVSGMGLKIVERDKGLRVVACSEDFPPLMLYIATVGTPSTATHTFVSRMGRLLEDYGFARQ